MGALSVMYYLSSNFFQTAVYALQLLVLNIQNNVYIQYQPEAHALSCNKTCNLHTSVH